ncbi:hypothetical protein [Microbispora sp. NPDC049125]|uniref:HAAS signaling domain-containing protein n=1 Tax=Microbispora sp. NPDC049125 TaxID=3154929 RepID=UPI0034661438
MSPSEYADAVREALADLPASDREELLEDLDDHLAEVAAEPGMPLEERLGSPEAYAAELRAAYGGRPAKPRLRVPGRAMAGLSTAFGRAHARLLDVPVYRQAAAFAPELRPGWWVLRGYAIGVAVAAAAGSGGGLAPGDPVAWVFTLVVIWASVWLGRRSAPGASRWERTLLVAANAVAAILVLGSMLEGGHSAAGGRIALDYDSAPPRAFRVENAATLTSGDVSNIFPYAEDGTPLRNVRLYDQEGRPLLVDPEANGQAIAVPCEGEPPLRNAYPLPLRPIGWVPVDGEPMRRIDEATGLPCVPAAPAPVPSSAPSATESLSPSPVPSSSESPSPSPSASPSASPGRSSRPSGSPSHSGG